MEPKDSADRSSTRPEGKPDVSFRKHEVSSVDPTLLARAEDWFGRMIESPIVVRHDSAVLVEASVLIRDLLQALKGGR